MKKDWLQVALCMALLVGLLSLALLYDNGSAATQTGGQSEITETQPAGNYIALTFDDGPRADTTSALLEGLEARGVKATFFLIGEQIEGNEWLLEWMAADGHQIGSHTFTHLKLQESSSDTIVQEINKTETLLRSILGEGEYWLRPPYGLIGESQKSLIQTPMVYWSVDPEDWKVLDAEKVTEHVCTHAQSGDIILLHDFYPTSVEAALKIVDRLQAEGYEFVTVAELLALYGTQAEPGKLYRNAWEER